MKLFARKSSRVIFFDKSQVCTYQVRNFLWGQKFLQIFFVLPQWISFSGFQNNFSCASSYFHLDNSLWSMRTLYANFWDVYFSTDSFQTSLTSKFEIIGEIALSKLHNCDRILQFLTGMWGECSLHSTVDCSPQPKKPRNSWHLQKYPEDCKLTDRGWSERHST